MKIKLYACLLAMLPAAALAQDYTASVSALKLPVTPHVAALGGTNITLVEDNPGAGWQNPALHANASDCSLGLNFMTFLSSTSWMGAHFTKAFGERHTLAAGAQYMNYGSMERTDATGVAAGTFRAKDLVFNVGYSYLLSDRWTGGANLKFIYSGIADYSAFSMAVDLGVNYFDEDNDLSLSAAVRNAGTQIKAFDDRRHAHLPYSLDLGMTKGMAHLPVRFHLTLTDLTRWKDSDFAQPTDADKAPSFGTKALNHVVVGLDVLPTDRIYLSVGYNFRRAYELKAAGSSHLAGFSAGGGLQVSRFSFGLSYAQYHQSGGSIMGQATYVF